MRSRPSRWLSPRCDRSAPAQKAGAVPVTTSAPTVGSASTASSPGVISSTIARVSALRRSGASRVTTATPSAMSICTSAMAAVWHRAGRRPQNIHRCHDRRCYTCLRGEFIAARWRNLSGLVTFLCRPPELGRGRRHRRTSWGAHLTTSRRRSRAAYVLVAAVMAASPVLVPRTSDAAPDQEGPPTSRDESGMPSVSGDDVLRADSADVAASLGEVSAEVQAQVAAVTAARRAETTAQAELAAAEEAVAETQASIDDLSVLSDEVVIESFINPPSESAIDTLSAESLVDATVKQSILTNQSNTNAQVLTDLQDAQAEPAPRKEGEAEAAATAEEKAAESEAALADLIADQSEETLFVLAVQDRLAG